jgi:hypothetical protein
MHTTKLYKSFQPLSTNRFVAKEKEEFRRWLSSNNFEVKKAKSLEARHNNTCHWIFATNEYKTWLSSKSSKLLWCHGKRT